MTEHKKDSIAAHHSEKEVRYMAEKMGVSIDEMRRLLSDSNKSAEELEREMLKPKPPKA